MISEDDWRLTNQGKYLRGETFYFKKYTEYSSNWDHDHCEFCSTKFATMKSDNIINEGYATKDNYRWICTNCFEDFKKMFGLILGKE